MSNRSKLWASVEKIILKHYSELKTERLRDGYYIVREYLSEDYLKNKKIAMKEFEHFSSNQGYSTYKDDLWVSIEKQKGLPRPEAKPLGMIYSLGQELPISKFDDVYERSRGFIFVEKAGEADDIKELSNHGWAIVAGQGFSTRLMRELLKEDKRPVLVLHDADIAGNWIFKIFDVGSRRTKHLKLWLNNVTDLGLTEQDATLLGLPSQPEAKKYKKQKKIRYELSAFSVLKHKLGLKNPVLAYTVAKMKEKGFRVTPSPEELQVLLAKKIELRVIEILSEFNEELFKLFELPYDFAKDVAKSLCYPKGTAIDAEVLTLSKLRLDTSLIDELKQKITEEFKKVRPKLTEKAQNLVDSPVNTDEDSYERGVVDKTDAKIMIDKLGDE